MKPNSDRKQIGNPKKTDNEERPRDTTFGGRRGGRRGVTGRGRGRNRGRIAAVTSGREYYDDDEEDGEEYLDEDENYYEEEYEEDEEEYGNILEPRHKAFVTIALATASRDQNNLSQNDVLLDSQANLSVFWNRSMLSNIVKAKHPIPYAGQTAEKDVKLTHYGEFMGIPKIWLDERGKANILSYHLAETHLVSNNRGYIDQIKQDGITVGWNLVVDEITLAFRVKMGGLHACNVKGKLPLLAAVNTVSENMSKYSKRDVKKARETSQLITAMNAIDESKLKDMLNGSMIANCNLVGRDVNTKMDIEGKNVASLKGKSRNKKVKHIPFNPKENKTMTDAVLHIDTMHYGGRLYVIGVVDPVDYTVAQRCRNQTADSVKKIVEQDIKNMLARSIAVREIRTDHGKPMLSGLKNIEGVRFNPSGSGAHEPVVENRIKTIKERLRANNFTNKPITVSSRLTDYQVYYVIQRLNMELSYNRSDKGIPWVAVTGCKLNMDVDFSLSFLDYVQAFDKNSVDAKKPERTTAGIALYRIANDAGSWLFYSLKTKRTFCAERWTKLPMPDIVVNILNQMQRIPRNIEAENDKEGDINWTKEPDPIPFNNDNANEETVISVTGEKEFPKVHIGQQTKSSNIHNKSVNISKTFEPVKQNTDLTNIDKSETNKKEKKHAAREAVIKTFPGLRRSARIKARNVNFNICKSTGHSENIESRGLFNISMAQAQKDRPIETKKSVIHELSSLHNMENLQNPFKVFKPIDISLLTREQRNKIIHSTMFLKDKTDALGNINELKSRLVVNEIKSRVANKENIDTSSPTVEFSAVTILTTLSLMGPMKIRRVFDVKQAYTKAKANRVLHVRLSAAVVNILCEMLPVYKNFINKDGTVIVELIQALYGTVDAGKLWYNEFANFLESIGFNRNPHERCVFNRKERDGSQSTIMVFVDDGHMICTSDEAADEIIYHIESKFGKMKIQTGNKLEYLGCLFDYSNDGYVVVTQRKHIIKVLKEYEVHKISKTPAGRNLMEIDDDSPLLSEKERQKFHSVVYQLLFITQRTRPEFMLSVNFLSGRCYVATEEDQRKLTRVIQYLKGTEYLGLKLTLNNGIPELSCHIDSSYGTHRDGKSQTGSSTSLGKGSIESNSSKQKVNTKSAHESEIIGLSDRLSRLIWARNMILDQGVKIGPAIVYQDNKGVLEVCKRGQNGNSRTKHIALRYNFVRDFIDRGEIILKYCPTKNMVADILTKPLQGKLFVDLRDKLLGWETI